ncbi:ribosome biogenesis GTP-binding protein YsxC/EngB [Thermanaerovibrio velox DSM 12556]|uniref:Probable GTP-binding protein EngB n=2 Tax=Thermanaerovibrio TaxID=81461 RepID=H0URZ0_9BACT|nr:ribosome biogenesis GTP-binding protein YihA/YsxC [Thermanaerovibrio velox]EHM10079.1 ribosome biogenesis GTP-binding protein YsxC/EngB [Thermanaerovibrio velox DSM 12556]
MLWRANLIGCAYRYDQIPRYSLPEVVMVGRSNVGKSSLINAMIGAKLAKVSKTPGKTRSINFFKVHGEPPFVLVDLPGYGFASRSGEERDLWKKTIERYFSSARMSLVLHLVDFRHGFLENDRQMEGYLEGIGLPVGVVFTKADKISGSKRKATLDRYVKEGFRCQVGPFLVSASTGFGLSELKSRLAQWLIDTCVTDKMD